MPCGNYLLQGHFFLDTYFCLLSFRFCASSSDIQTVPDHVETSPILRSRSSCAIACSLRASLLFFVTTYPRYLFRRNRQSLKGCFRLFFSCQASDEHARAGIFDPENKIGFRSGLSLILIEEICISVFFPVF